jgi:hypothetical protein
MGRHTDASGSSFKLRRTTHLAGLTGGAAWLLAAVLQGGALDRALLWLGAALLTVTLCGLGLLLVHSDVRTLRFFVALALPILVWGVFWLVRGGLAHPDWLDGGFGAVVGLVSAVRLRRLGRLRRRADGVRRSAR